MLLFPANTPNLSSASHPPVVRALPIQSSTKKLSADIALPTGTAKPLNFMVPLTRPTDVIFEPHLFDPKTPLLPPISKEMTLIPSSKVMRTERASQTKRKMPHRGTSPGEMDGNLSSLTGFAKEELPELSLLTKTRWSVPEKGKSFYDELLAIHAKETSFRTTTFPVFEINRN